MAVDEKEKKKKIAWLDDLEPKNDRKSVFYS